LWGITYCVPLPSSSSFKRLLAVEVTLDWLFPLMKQQLTQSEQVNYLELGDPFVWSQASEQWIVSSKELQLVRSWLAQENTTASDRLCLIIGDVADKGFPAALLMARTVIRACVSMLPTAMRAHSRPRRKCCGEP
jgi:hypothetical protein